METVSKSARKEILAVVRVRYEQASKLEKGKILSEFAAVAGYHRKHAIRLLNPRPEVGVKTVVEGARIYGAAVKAALVLLWETADRICGKRLKAAMPHLVNAMERHGHLKLDAEVRKQVLLVSAATMDRMLTPERKGAGIRRKRRLPKKLRKEIPIKTFADWKDPMPGFGETEVGPRCVSPTAKLQKSIRHHGTQNAIVLTDLHENRNVQCSCDVLRDQFFILFFPFLGKWSAVEIEVIVALGEGGHRLCSQHGQNPVRVFVREHDAVIAGRGKPRQDHRSVGEFRAPKFGADLRQEIDVEGPVTPGDTVAFQEVLPGVRLQAFDDAIFK